MDMYGHVWTCMWGGLRSNLGFTPQDSTLFSETGSLIGLKINEWTWLPGKGAPGIHLSLFPQ